MNLRSLLLWMMIVISDWRMLIVLVMLSGRWKLHGNFVNIYSTIEYIYEKKLYPLHLDDAMVVFVMVT